MDEDIIGQVQGFVSNELDEQNEETEEPVPPPVSAVTALVYHVTEAVRLQLSSP